MVLAKSDPNVLTVGWRKEGETVASTLLAFWIELLTEYKPPATTSDQAASHLICEARRLPIL